MNRILSRVPSFRRDVRRLILVTGIFSVSFFGVQQLLKILYVLRLGYGPGYLGLFNASGALTYMAMSLPSGILGTRFGMRRVMLFGGVTTVVGMAILPLVEFVPAPLQSGWPIFSQMLSTGGWALFNVNLVPALMTATTPRNRDSAYSLTSVMRGTGTFVGTLVGGLLPGFFGLMLGLSLDDPAPYRWGLWLGASLGIVAVVLLARTELEPPEVQSEQTATAAAFPLVLLVLLIVHVYLGQAGWALCQSFCNAYMDSDLQLSPSAIGLLTGAGQFVAMLSPLLTPRLSRRFGNGQVLMATTALTGLFLVPLALIPHWTAAGMGRLGVLALAAIWMPASQVYQMELFDKRWRGPAYGIISMSMALSFGSMSLIGGYVANVAGYSSLFLLGTALSTIGAVWMWFALRTPYLRRSQPHVATPSPQRSVPISPRRS